MNLRKIILLTIVFQLFYSLVNAQIKLIGNITTNGIAEYPTHIDSLSKGGYMSMPTIALRDAIPALRRKYGMLVFVQADGVIYKLNAVTLANADWVALSFGATTNVDAGTLTGTTLNATITGSSLTSVGTLVAGAVPYSLLTGTIPTFNQNTTGNAATATTATTAGNITATSNTTLTSLSNLTTVGTLVAGAVPYSLLTGTIPTFNQNTTGNAATATTATTAGTATTTTGNAGTATKLATARSINGVAFDGTGDITITASSDAGTLTGTTLNATVTGSSLTSVGTLANLTVTNPIAGSITGNAATATTATTAGTATTTIGNAGTATKLATARNINGVAFDGTGDITITSTADAGTLTGTTLKSTVTGSSLTSVGTITSGVWSGTAVAVEKGGTGATSASAARINLGLEIGANVQAPLTAGTSYIVPNASITGATNTKLTYDAKGLVTAGSAATTADIAVSTNKNYVTDVQSGVLSNTSGTNTGDQTITLTGDLTGTGTGTFTSTLANSGVSANSYGSSTSIPTFTVDAKGRLTTASTASIIADAGTLTGTTLNSTITGSSLTSVGTLVAGSVPYSLLTGTVPIFNQSTTGNAATATTATTAGTATTTTGNAGTATKLATARNINGVSFDGSENIDITSTSDAGTLTGTTLNATVIGSSLTSVGTLIAGSVPYSLLTGTDLLFQKADTSTLSNRIDQKLNILDTATMLINYLAGINNLDAAKLNITDTATMLANYLAGINNLDAAKLNITDTATMLANYLAGINNLDAAKLNITDTATMLANYLAGINNLDAAKLNITDTATMLANYLAGINNLDAAKLNILDTAIHAISATQLATARTINGVAFDGSENINITASSDAGTLTGTTLNATVTGSSLTSVGTLNSATVNGKVIVGASSAASASAVLEASSTTQGFLPPRMTSTQRNAISSPVAGLTIWNTTYVQLEVYNGSLWVNMNGTSDQAPTIGQYFQGGIVAYILVSGDPGYDANTQHGLIAATSDQSTGIQWYNGSSTTTGATGKAIGTGLSNTNAIITSQGASTAYAAGLARAYKAGGYTDWYLPSKDELNKLYALKQLGFGGFAGGFYWSSTELDSIDGAEYDTGFYQFAWMQGFTIGNQGFNTKAFDEDGMAGCVRAIRAF